MKTVSTVSMLAASCGLLGACDNTNANPAERVIVESPSRQSALEPGVASNPTLPTAAYSRSDAYTDDFDADGIADTRSVGFVMCFERRCSVDKFTIDRVLYFPVNCNGDRLLHFIANHFSDPFFPVVPFHEEIIF